MKKPAQKQNEWAQSFFPPACTARDPLISPLHLSPHSLPSWFLNPRNRTRERLHISSASVLISSPSLYPISLSSTTPGHRTITTQRLQPPSASTPPSSTVHLAQILGSRSKRAWYITKDTAAPLKKDR